MKIIRLILSLVLLMVGNVALAGGVFRAVAVVGDPAVGLPAGREFSNFLFGPSLDNAGHATFRGDSAVAPGQPPTVGLWSEHADGLRLVISQGAPAPGVGPGIDLNIFGTTIQIFGTTIQASDGGLATTAGLSNNASAYLLDDGVAPRLIGVTGTSVPGIADVAFGTLVPSNPLINSYGETAFVSRLVGDSVTGEDNEAIWSEAGGGGLRMIARMGETLPGLQPGETVGFFTLGEAPQIDDLGRTAFIGRTLPSTPGTTDRALWINDPSTGTRLVARTGHVVEGHEIDLIDSLRLNNSGQAAFGARDIPAGGGATIDGLFVENGDESFHRVIVESDPAAGVDANFVAVNTFSYDFGDRGQTVFAGSIDDTYVTGGNKQGLWIDDPEAGQQLVMLQGDLAPVPAGESPAFFGFPLGFQTNDDGAVAFFAALLAEGQIQSTRNSIWIRQLNGDLERIVAIGDLLEFDVGGISQAHQVRSLRLGMATKSIPQPRYFNDNGQIAFQATFEDGTSGLFVYTPVPEPAAMTLLAMACLSLAGRSRCRVSFSGKFRFV